MAHLDHSGSSMMNRRWGVGLGLICLMCLCLFLWRYTHQPTMVLRIETLSSQSDILQLQRVIEAQKKTIELYAKRPKVIFRCLDDEPKMKYPRHASDDYTAVTMGTNDECGLTEQLDAVMIVHSSASNFQHRERFRAMYSNYSVTYPYKLKVAFLLGQVKDANLQINLEVENRQYGDTIQGNFIDTYQNLTLKAVMGYRWIKETCQNYKLLLKMDDDVAFDVHRFFGDYWHNLRKDKKVRRIFCQVWKHATVNREGKWKVEKGLFKNATYDFPYCSGFFVVITADIVIEMYKNAKSLDFFWIDDVFMYGMVPHVMKTVGFTQFGSRANKITQTLSVYKDCKKKQGIDCPYFAAVTSSGEELKAIYNTFPHQVLMQTKINKNSTQSSLQVQKADSPENKKEKVINNDFSKSETDNNGKKDLNKQKENKNDKTLVKAPPKT